MTTRFFSVLLILLGMSLPAAAQTPASPRFLLESVVVEGTQRDAVRQIVAAESLLQSGREYSEQELREAVYRVKRLPFVLDAEFSLRKGGERGSYQLVITVEETRLVFFSVDAGGIYDADDQRVGPDEDRIDWGAGAQVGGRWFVGSQGLVFANVLGVEEIGPYAAQAGYTHYNLFGRGGFASAILSTDISDESQGSDSYQGALSMGIPIVGNHSLRADLNVYRSDYDDAFSRTRSESRRLWLSWDYNTTNDPLFPTSGTRLNARVGYIEDEREDRFQDPLLGEVRFEDTSKANELGIFGERHWSLTRRQSLSADLSGYWSETDNNDNFYGKYEYWQGAAGLGHSTDLWGFEKTERFGDLRWENTLQILRSDSDSFFGDTSSTDGRLTTGVVFRNAWGVTRLSFSYIDNLDRSVRARNVL